MTHPLVTIITPTFNHEKYISNCIKSVLAQKYTDWEMIIIDDHSSDNTLEVINSLAKGDDRFLIIRHSKNYGIKGLAETYGEAFSIASGELIAILEGDDFWSRHKLKTQVQVFRDANVILSYTDYDEVEHNSIRIASRKYRVSKDSLKSNIQQNFSFFSKLNNFASNTVMIRKKTLEEIGGFRKTTLPLIDYPTFLELSLKGNFYRVPETLGFWRRHNHSTFYNNRAGITQMSADYFKSFCMKHEKYIGRNNINIPAMLRNIEHSVIKHRLKAPYAEARYQLLFGDNKKARKKFISILKSNSTPFICRIGGYIGLIFSFVPSKYYINFNRFSTQFLSYY